MAAGPKTIAREFVERLSRIQDELSRIYFALGHAPGCDLFDWGRWQTMYHTLEEVQASLEKVLEAAKAEAEQADEGTYEEIIQHRDSLEGAVEERLRDSGRPV